MKKIMILGASEFQIPMVVQAKKMGIRTCVVDYRRTAPAVEHADDYFRCSLKDLSQIVSFAKEYLPDGATAGASDVAVPAAAEVCAALGLPGLDKEAARRATDKYEMALAFEEAGVPHPRFVRLSSLEALDKLPRMDYPMISKPVDMSSSKGIRVAHSEEGLLDAVMGSMRASDSGEILLEEYMVGPEVSVEVLVLDGCPMVLQVTDKVTSGPPNFVEVGHSQPSVLPPKTVEEIGRVACAAAIAMGIVNGFAHAEIIVTDVGPKMVEVGARMGGDGIQQYLISLSTGLNLQEIAIRLAFGERVVLPAIYGGTYSAIRFLPSVPGRVVSIEGFDAAAKIDGIALARAMCSVGDEFGESQDNSCRFGYVVSRGESRDEAVRCCEDALQKIEVRVE